MQLHASAAAFSVSEMLRRFFANVLNSLHEDRDAYVLYFRRRLVVTNRLAFSSACNDARRDKR